MVGLELDTKFGLSQEDIGKEVMLVWIYMLETMKATMFVPGKVENFNMIIDLAEVGITQCPFTVLKIVIGCLQMNYRCCSKRLLILNACFSIRMGWKAVDMVLSDSTRKKIVLVDKNTCPELTDNSDAWMVEE